LKFINFRTAPQQTFLLDAHLICFAVNKIAASLQKMAKSLKR